jgi:hypothetical protein
MQGPWSLNPRDIQPTINLLAEYLCQRLLTPQRVGSLMKPLPRYVERNRNGLSFCVGRGARIPLPNDPTSPEFRAAYSAALVDAIAAEDDNE